MDTSGGGEAGNDIWDQLLDKLLNIGDDINVNEPSVGGSDASLHTLEDAAPSSPPNTERSSTASKGHARHGSDVVKLIDKDDIWSKGSGRLALQKQHSLGKRPSLETVSENGPEESETYNAHRKFSVRIFFSGGKFFTHQSCLKMYHLLSHNNFLSLLGVF